MGYWPQGWRVRGRWYHPSMGSRGGRVMVKGKGIVWLEMSGLNRVLWVVKG